MNIYQRSQHADQLVRDGMSLRAACRIAGVSRHTLQRYRDGEVQPDGRVMPVVYRDSRSVVLFNQDAPPRRCVKCGRLVRMPCLACQLVEV